MVSKKQKSDNDLLHEISEKLDKITSMLAIQGKDVDIQIEILHNLGWEWVEIGKYVGMTADATRMRYSRKK